MRCCFFCSDGAFFLYVKPKCLDKVNNIHSEDSRMISEM